MTNLQVAESFLRRSSTPQRTWMKGLPSLSMTSNGQDCMSFLTSGSSYLRPMRRLASKTVAKGPVVHEDRWIASFTKTNVERTHQSGGGS